MENADHDIIPLDCGGTAMKRLVEGTDRGQSTLFLENLEDWIDGYDPVRMIDVVVDELDR